MLETISRSILLYLLPTINNKRISIFQTLIRIKGAQRCQRLHKDGHLQYFVLKVFYPSCVSFNFLSINLLVALELWSYSVNLHSVLLNFSMELILFKWVFSSYYHVLVFKLGNSQCVRFLKGTTARFLMQKETEMKELIKHFRISSGRMSRSALQLTASANALSLGAKVPHTTRHFSTGPTHTHARGLTLIWLNHLNGMTTHFTD